MTSGRYNRLGARKAGSVFAGMAFALALTAGGAALAQTSSNQAATDNVVINWGALGGGTAAAPAPAPSYSAPSSGVVPYATGGLLMPGPVAPGSELYVAPSGGGSIQLQKPGSAPKMTAKPAAPMIAQPAPAPAPMPAPAPKPAPAKVAAPAPAPPPAPAPAKLAEKKAPEPAKSETASAPPPPPPAPETAAAPPPPPPAPAAGAAAPPAPPKPEEQAKATAAETPATEQASTPPAGGPMQVVFNGDDTKLSADGQKALEGVLAKLSGSESTRVQLMAYAAGDELTSSKARRISLSRALSVRSYLIEKGVRSTRIDVRALGDKAEGDPKNRVDVNFVDR